MRIEGSVMLPCSRRTLDLAPVTSRELRLLFDRACGEIHYAGACQRVGRCMRLAISVRGEWAGGVVLGSTFPGIGARDEALGLRDYLRGYRQRGLVSAWAGENRDYWSRLQGVVNHARTFVFPDFQGEGIGVKAHALLLTRGRELWEERYPGRVWALDTLCTSSDSRMFLDNGWELVGRTAGYSRDPSRSLSKRLADDDTRGRRDNAGLSIMPGSYRWWVWVRRIAETPLGRNQPADLP
jgi:GNAT superfamily N-acetyltransferase